MASLLVTRGLYSLIASRDTVAGGNVAWNAITRRDSEKQRQIVSTVLLSVWVIANILLFVPVFFIVSNLHRPQHTSRIWTR